MWAPASYNEVVIFIQCLFSEFWILWHRTMPILITVTVKDLVQFHKCICILHFIFQITAFLIVFTLENSVRRRVVKQSNHTCDSSVIIVYQLDHALAKRFSTYMKLHFNNHWSLLQTYLSIINTLYHSQATWQIYHFRIWFLEGNISRAHTLLVTLKFVQVTCICLMCVINYDYTEIMCITWG